MYIHGVFMSCINIYIYIIYIQIYIYIYIYAYDIIEEHEKNVHMILCIYIYSIISSSVAGFWTPANVTGPYCLRRAQGFAPANLPRCCDGG